MTKQLITSWQRLINLLRMERKDVLQILYYAIFAGGLSLILPLGIQAIINLIQGAQVSTSWIVLVVLVTLSVAFTGTLQLMQLRIVENLQQKIFTKSSIEFAYRFPKIKMSELHNYYPPELANRFFDTLMVQKGVSKLLLDIPASLLQIIFGLLLLSFYHPFFIIYGLFLIILIYLVFKFTITRGLETSLLESKYKYKVAHWIQEIARSIISFKLSGKTSLALQKNDVLVKDYLSARENHFRILVIQYIQMIGFKVLVTAGLLLIGGLLVLNQQMNIGQFVAAEIIILLVIGSVEKLIISLETMYDVLTSLEKIGQVVDKDLESQIGEKPFKENECFKISLEKVCYTTPKRDYPILSDISFVVEPKSSLLIQGASGAGKSTLLRIIAGVLEPSRGDIYINDVSLKGIYLNHYRAQIGHSLSGETPFEGTILENITFGDAAISEETVNWAVGKTGLREFVKHQPKGIKTMIYPEGKQISETVAKKILLARAIVKKPSLLILEDALEQFDTEEANKIIDFILDKNNKWTLIVVGEQKHWREKCERIIELENGNLIKDSRHA
ncbi:peptidase domain-containing ABC transporter [Paucihalobacter sp.]|uniref:peptidase domain-containing ABC transporter n=1 Tax=Paucihalobacter sp. TaxID=2850405 RepID=UPI002FE34C3D